MTTNIRPFLVVWLVLNVYFLVLPPVSVTPIWYVLGTAVFVSWLMLVTAVWQMNERQRQRETRDHRL